MGKAVIEQIEARLIALEENSQLQRTHLEDLDAAVDKATIQMNNRFQELRRIVSAIDPATYQELYGRHKELSELFEVVIDRYTMLTEMVYYGLVSPDIADDWERLRIVKAALFHVDSDDEWVKMYKGEPVANIVKIAIEAMEHRENQGKEHMMVAYEYQ